MSVQCCVGCSASYDVTYISGQRVTEQFVVIKMFDNKKQLCGDVFNATGVLFANT